MIVLPTVVALLLIMGFVPALGWFAGRADGASPPSLDPGILMWRLGIAVTVLMLGVVNLNMWLPGRGIHISIAAGSLMSLGALALASARKRIEAPSTVALVVAVAALTVGALLLWFYAMFGVRGLWLLEGPNHDSLFYFEGAQWAVHHPLRAAPVLVNAEWGLGTCRQGAVFIGTDCAAYRGGTYSLLALGLALIPKPTANQMLATMALAALFPILGMLSNVAPINGAGRRSVRMQATILIAAGALLFLTPAMVGTIVNGNVATVFGASVIAMMVLWAVTPHATHRARAVALGLAAALAGHLYGEAAAYACWVAAFGVIGDAVRLKRPSWIVVGGIIALACFALGMNAQLADLVRSYLELGKMTSGGDWAGFFLSAQTYYWISSPFTGILMGGAPPVTKMALIVGGLLTVSTLAICWRNGQRVAALGVIGLTLLLVTFIEVRNYAYGEHKIIQLLGPAWTALLLVGIWHLWRGAPERGLKHRLAAAAISALLVLQVVAFTLRAKELLVESMPSHALARDFAVAFDQVQPGDEVIIDDSGTAGSEEFQKSHYIAFLLHSRRAKALFPDMDPDSLRGGYVRSILRNGLEHGGSPDWLVQMKSDTLGTKRVIDRTLQADDLETQEYTLFRINERNPEPVVVAGKGWYPCESTHCWTAPSFSVEVFVPDACQATDGGAAYVSLELEYFVPPSNGTLTVANGSGRMTFDASSAHSLRIPVKRGWNRLWINSDWPEQSPRSLGMSVDGRALFAKVSRISTACGPG